MKKCGKCKEVKNLSEFHSNPTKKDGVQSMCKICRKEYHREHYLENKEKYISNNQIRRNYFSKYIKRYKSFCGCKKCNDKRWYVLEFHHLRDKDFDIGINSNRTNINKIKNEIRKCIVICANCHRELHYLERQASNA